MSLVTLYPLLHSMESKGILEKEEKTVKYYKITTLGNEVLEEALRILITIGLNKGKAMNALTRAIFF